MSSLPVRSQLFNAIKVCDCAKIRKILSKYPQLLNRPESRNKPSPLWTAMLNGDEEIVDLLISEFGADPNEKCSPMKNIYYAGWTFLKYAASCELTLELSRVSKVLLKHGAKINGWSKEVNELRDFYVTQENVQFVEFLLKNGVNLPSYPTFHRWLVRDLFSLKKNRKEMLILLLNYGLDTSCKNDARHTNILHVFSNSYKIYEDFVDTIDVAEILIDQAGISVNEPDMDGLTPLHHVTWRQHIPLISFFIKKGADVCAENKSGRTPFSLIVCGPSAEQYANCLYFILKEFSKLTFKNIKISKKDLDSINENSITRECFELCMNELQQMTATVFYPPFSYYSVLNMERNIKQLAKLTKNEEFLEKFNANSNSFPYYEEDLRETLEEATEFKIKLDAVESRLKYIFGDYFPDIVTRKLAGNLTFEDLSLD